MAKIALTLALLIFCVPASGEAWRPSDFEIRGWNAVVSAQAPESDGVFSPVGLALSVAMLGEGTGGTHRANIAEAFGLLSDFGAAFSHVLRSYAEISASNAVSIAIAPSLWSGNPRKLDLDYRRSLQRNFSAETGSLSSILPINAWTEAKTDGKIKNVIDGIPPRTEIMLLNAIAFEGAWEKEFDPGLTAEGDFRREGGGTARVRFMRGARKVMRVEEDGYTAIRLPFAAKGISMLYILPPEGAGISAFRAKWGDEYSIDSLKSVFRVGFGRNISEEEMDLSIPAMEMHSRWDLRGTLASFKVPVSGYARIGEDFRVDRVLQAACIRVSETGYSLTPGVEPPQPEQERAPRRYSPGGTIIRNSGTETFEEKAAGEKTAKALRLDRPFIFMVWEENTDTIVLAGQFTGKAK